MLYDNALLTVAYTEAWQITGDPEFERVVREILHYIARDMTSPQGAFYSATDADSPVPGTDESEEGWFFTWTPNEVRACLDAEHAKAVIAWYAVGPQGNFEGRSILYTPRDAAVVAAELGLTQEQLARRIVESKEIMVAERAKRPGPIRDEKILAGWNGLMISAHARAAQAFSDPSYAVAGERAADFVLSEMRDQGRLMRTYKDGQARHDAMVEDYAFLVAGLLDLFEATGQRRWLQEAIALDAVVAEHYEDKETGGWYRSPDDGESLLAREKPDNDGAEPTGASVHTLNLFRLNEFTTLDAYRQRAVKSLQAHGKRIAQGSLSEMLLAVDWHLDRPKEIVLVTPNSRLDAEPFLRILNTAGPRNHVLAVLTPQQAASMAKLVPWVGGKVTQNQVTTAYVCEQGVCDFPTTDPQVFRSQLASSTGLNRP
jgi:uncharacterized protein YyaL (SSP411 family)